MKLRVFSVVGEALNFGARRMETIMRVSWLPVVLLLVAQMAALFGFLSVAAGRFITFADVRTYTELKGYLVQSLNYGLAKDPGLMLAIAAGYVIVVMILYASFMAPLIRFSGLGERPAPGVVRMPFGPDQLRYIFSGLLSILIVAILFFAPMATATYFVIQYVNDAMSQTMASFPNPESLHTIELITARDALASSGGAWFYDLGVPLIAAVPFATIAWIGTILHFRPANRGPNAGPPNLILRAFVSLVVLAGVFGGIFYFLASLRDADAGSQGLGLLALTTLFMLILFYVNLRLTPYPGVAVCRKSMAPAHTLEVSRGWNIVRLFFVVLLLGVFLTLSDYFLNTFALSQIQSTIITLFQATTAYTKLLNSGEAGAWVLPLFIWIWNGIKILVNIFWIFFSSGVAAGLFGRLYRESEHLVAARAGAPAVWRSGQMPREELGDL